MSKKSRMWKGYGFDSWYTTTYSGICKSDPVAIRCRVRHQGLDESILIHTADLHQLGTVILTHLLSSRPRWCRRIWWEIAVTTRPICCKSIWTCTLIGGESCTNLCNNSVGTELLKLGYNIYCSYFEIHFILLFYGLNNQDHVHQF